LTRLRLAFLGTPEFAVPSLEALIGAGHEVAAVYSQPPRPAGRGHKLRPSPVHEAAAAAGIEVRTPRTLRDSEEQRRFAALDLDAGIVVAYGLILPRPILAAPRRGCINVHASLLPRWRGAAPIHRALLAGDAETGVTIMQMDEGLDTGPMLLSEKVPIGPRDTTRTLHDRLAALGARLLVEALERRPAPVPQPADGATYAAKVAKEEGRLDWRRDAAALERAVRALDAWFELGGERVKVLEAAVEPGAGPPGTVLDDRLAIACGTGVFRPAILQRAGRGPAALEAFLRGFPVPRGTVLPCNATG
jgi:methionyl-tRNA formyltransferase